MTATMNATVHQELESARARFVARHPRSAALHEQARQVMPGGNTRTVLYHAPFPLRVARAEGSRLWDADGHAYTDVLGEYTAGIYGHSHPVILAAIREALEGGLVLNGHTEAEIHLARAIAERFPSLERLRFTNSGTEANLMALALAVAHTGRRSVMVFDGGYHGGVLYFGGGGSPVNVPHRFVVVPYNDPGSARAAALEHADDLAAILVEPMLGSSGCIPGTPEFLGELRALATQTGALLIFDEVMTSRLAPGGLQGALGITPDLTTLGKYLGGGLSFGAFGGRADAMRRFDPGEPDALPHAGTFNNNILSMTAGYAGLSRVFTPEACVALNARGDALRDRLNAHCQARGARVQFVGRGSMMTFHATTAAIRNASDALLGDADLKELIFFDLLERGFWVARRGMVNLSLTLTDGDLERFEAAFVDVLEERAALLG